MTQKHRKLGEILRSTGQVTENQLQEALAIGGKQELRLGEVLVGLGYVADGDIAKALANQFGMEFVDLENPATIAAVAVDTDTFKLLPTELVMQYRVVALGKANGRLKVLIHDPLDLNVIDALRFRMNCPMDFIMGIRRQIDAFVRRAHAEIGDRHSACTGRQAKIVSRAEVA
ncbi:MAG: hypothetical protein NTW19_16185 [Planctomycetota bacterium]|nr:hypothetical protein [Planctomycetota bacterium]